MSVIRATYRNIQKNLQFTCPLLQSIAVCHWKSNKSHIEEPQKYIHQLNSTQLTNYNEKLKIY